MNPHDLTLIVSASVRYWEDSSINGVPDNDGTLTPLRSGSFWVPVIELGSGTVRNWPSGVQADIHFKVCDAGEYWLGDLKEKKLFKWAGDYVPDRLLAVGSSGYGDYIILEIGADGVIKGWNPPLLDSSEWEVVW